MIKYFNEDKEFHIYNDYISYVLKVLPNGRLINLYFGKKITRNNSFSHLLQIIDRPLAIYQKEGIKDHSLQFTKMEYPVYGTGDFRSPAVEIEQLNGSKIIEPIYKCHDIYEGKKSLQGLPCLYIENQNEASSLDITLLDELTECEIVLHYTIYNDYPLITRSVNITNKGEEEFIINKVFSTSLDLPDYNYNMIQLSGAWARERYIKERKLEQGIQSFGSNCGCSSSDHNPFLLLKRPNTTENSGEAIGLNLLYSGNHLEQVEVSTHGITRVLQGINPDTFSWNLKQNESFQSPESVIVYSDKGINYLSQTFHKVFQKRLVRGYWRDKERPVLINNWEATEMNFTESSIINMAIKAKKMGVELLVLDDGWFGNRDDDTKGLGDWFVTNFDKLPNGISGLSKKIEDIGLKFGIWIEPEMVNKDSKLYKKHPSWCLQTPSRTMSCGRNQYVLDYSNNEVIDYIYLMLKTLIESSHISYIKWDMNRYITECYSNTMTSKNQGKVFHKYILGVYSLYERLITSFPNILFESCASGGSRFDAGMLYYAPQTWTSDNSDAISRLKIQYGTSYAYPLSSMGSHVSSVPNQQVGRVTSLQTRANVAMFGAFGYELDFQKLSDNEQEEVQKQIVFIKKHRKLLQFGTFYRLISPFTNNYVSWIVVSEDKREAIIGYYNILGEANDVSRRLYVQGLNPNILYHISGDNEVDLYGDELMNAGITIPFLGERGSNVDFTSTIFYLCARPTSQ